MKSKNLSNSKYTWIPLLTIVVIVILITMFLINRKPILFSEHMNSLVNDSSLANNIPIRYHINQLENFNNYFSSKMKIYNIKYKTQINFLQSNIFHPLTANGPFFDAHFGSLTSKTPIGQTYYIRPITEYTPPCNNVESEYNCDEKNRGEIEFFF